LLGSVLGFLPLPAFLPSLSAQEFDCGRLPYPPPFFSLVCLGPRETRHLLSRLLFGPPGPILPQIRKEFCDISLSVWWVFPVKLSWAFCSFPFPPELWSFGREDGLFSEVRSLANRPFALSPVCKGLGVECQPVLSCESRGP